MKRQRKAMGLAHGAIGIAVLGSAAIGAYSSWVHWGRAMHANVLATATDGPLLTNAASTALQRSRLTPEALAAAGLSGEDATALLARVGVWWSEHGTACGAACASGDSAGITLDSLQRKARSGLASGEDLTSLGSATSAYASAKAGHAAQMEAIWEAAVEGLDGGKVQRLESIRDHLEAGRRLPVAYLVVERSQSQTLALRDALTEVEADGENADSGATSLVDAANGDGTISAAKTNLANNLAEVSSAWSSALSG